MKFFFYWLMVILPSICCSQNIKPPEIQTTEEMIASVKQAMKEMKLKFRESATNEDIVFGLQHTMGAKFKETPNNFTKISNYYKSLASEISSNKIDSEIFPEFIKALSDLTIDDLELRNIAKKIIIANNKYSQDTKSSKLSVGSESIQESNLEVDKDKRIQNDPDGRNELLVLSSDNKQQRTIVKQYLASLLEPIEN